MRPSKKIKLVFVLVLLSNVYFSQDWVWKHITDSINRGAIFGIKGTGTTLTRPGARSLAMTWVDSLGNLWLYGGIGNTTNFSSGELSDMWKYNVSTDTWTWMNGPNLIKQYGYYGTKGIPNSNNTPGARHSAITWKDKNGNFWMFGGQGYASIGASGWLNDLWRFNPYTNEWTWISGPNLSAQGSQYGTLGVPSTTNIPGSRCAGIGWTDSLGLLWMFGGNGFSSSGPGGPLSDLWKFNISTNEWTWIKGPNIGYQNGVYGTLGVSSPTNNPGSRFWSNGFKDKSGNFFLFGGEGYGSISSIFGVLNDVWKYNIASNTWTWLNGVNYVNPAANFGTLGISSPSNTPGGKYRSTSWADSSGNFWLFGGYDQNNLKWSDLWYYNTSLNEWAWLNGSTTPNQWGNYGTINVPSSSNYPGGRASAASWTDKNGLLWMFGGIGNSTSTFGSGNMNDLWQITFVVSTGVFGSVKENTVVYPNPASNQVTINSPNRIIGSCQIFDLTGKLVIEKEINKFYDNVDVRNLRSGLYTIKIISSSGIQTRKLSIINN